MKVKISFEENKNKSFFLDHILDSRSSKHWMKSLEEMCSSLKLRSDEVNQECKELRESVELKKKEVEKTTADIMEL